MATASELEVLDCGRAAIGERHQMVILEQAALGTSPRVPDERALCRIADPDGAPDGGGDVPRAARSSVTDSATSLVQRRTCAPTAAALGVTATQLSLFQPIDEQCQRTIEDGRGISVRHHVPKQLLGPAQLVMCLAGDRQLQLVPLGRDRRPNRRTCRCRCK